VFCLAVLATSPFAVTPVGAATLAATTTCSNGVDNAGGQGLICEVTIENTMTAVGGSATVTVRECHGAAGDPEAACTIQVSILTEPVTSVDQCNGSINGGGGTLRCSVQVRNTYVAEDPSPVGVTVNQCVGSGDGFTVGCDPFPATTIGATITQCNGSANGGTLVRHLMNLRPNFVKVDVGLVRGVNFDLPRQAVIAGLVQFAAVTGALVVAEGIETLAEAETVKRLGVGLGQGYLFGRAATVEAWELGPEKVTSDSRPARTDHARASSHPRPHTRHRSARAVPQARESAGTARELAGEEGFEPSIP
jgi:EAL domain-containing protein